MKFFSTVMAILFFSQVVLAQDTSHPENLEHETQVVIEVIPQMKGDIAPYDGLLVPEDRLSELLNAEINVEQLEKEKEVDQRHMEKMEGMYEEQLDKATEPDPWYKTPNANRLIGFLVGAALAILGVYAGAKIVKAND